MELFHFTDNANKDNILKNGLKASTKYEIFTPIRENVVFCWLKKEDNKLFKDNQICFKINVDDERCLIADMDYVSMATYRTRKGAKIAVKEPYKTIDFYPYNAKKPELSGFFGLPTLYQN